MLGGGAEAIVVAAVPGFPWVSVSAPKGRQRRRGTRAASLLSCFCRPRSDCSRPLRLLCKFRRGGGRLPSAADTVAGSRLGALSHPWPSRDRERLAPKSAALRSRCVPRWPGSLGCHLNGTGARSRPEASTNMRNHCPGHARSPAGQARLRTRTASRRTRMRGWFWPSEDRERRPAACPSRSDVPREGGLKAFARGLWFELASPSYHPTGW